MDDHPSVKRLNKLSNINLIHLGNNSKHQQIFNVYFMSFKNKAI